MREHQILYKNKEGKKCIIVGYWDSEYKMYVFKFTKEELIDTLKELGVKPKFKIVKWG